MRIGVSWSSMEGRATAVLVIADHRSLGYQFATSAADSNWGKTMAAETQSAKQGEQKAKVR